MGTWKLLLALLDQALEVGVDSEVKWVRAQDQDRVRELVQPREGKRIKIMAVEVELGVEVEVVVVVRVARKQSFGMDVNRVERDGVGIHVSEGG